MSYLFTSPSIVTASLRSFRDSYLSTSQSSSEDQGPTSSGVMPIYAPSERGSIEITGSCLTQGGGIPTKYFTHIHPLNKADENDPHYLGAKEGVESDLDRMVDDLIKIRNAKVNQTTPTNALMTRSMGSSANSWARRYPGISFVTNTPNGKIVRAAYTGTYEGGLVYLLGELGEDDRDSNRT